MSSSYMPEDEKLAFEDFKSKVKVTDEEFTQICLASWAKLKPEERKDYYPAPLPVAKTVEKAAGGATDPPPKDLICLGKWPKLKPEERKAYLVSLWVDGSTGCQGLIAPMKVSPELAAIIGVTEATRAQCIKHLWAYIKENNLHPGPGKQTVLHARQEDGLG